MKLVVTPDVCELTPYWENWSEDPRVPQYYADTRPRSLEELYKAVHERYVFALGYLDGSLVGAIWLHDLGPRSSDRPLGLHEPPEK